jgi:hypothetical protein
MRYSASFIKSLFLKLNFKKYDETRPCRALSTFFQQIA